MPKSRPQLSITLPKNFAYHAPETLSPKTPKARSSVPSPNSPPVGPLRLKKRSRPAISSLFEDRQCSSFPPADQPLPSVETNGQQTSSRSTLYSGSLNTALALSLGRSSNSICPRTPEPSKKLPLNSWMSNQDIGESISRPLSTCTLISESSDTSTGTLASYPPGDGSCTSPESEVAFKLPSDQASEEDEIHRPGVRECAGPGTSRCQRTLQTTWSSEMDRHLWSTYLLYLQNPTFTPFKMLPGVAPPLGVCHRVAREAKKTWRGSKDQRCGATPSLQSPISFQQSNLMGMPHKTPASPATVCSARSRSLTPISRNSHQKGLWPKSGSSTRRRLRYLCKVKPSIAPHYQRLLQSRSPSPVSSRTSSMARSQSQLSQASHAPHTTSSTFNTRDVHLSLTTSTADTMQPEGPLARLTNYEDSAENRHTRPIDENPVLFASEIPIPSDIDRSPALGNNAENFNAMKETPRLGSPFVFHTWGPSRSKIHLGSYHQPSATSNTTSLGSPFRSPEHGETPLMHIDSPHQHFQPLSGINLHTHRDAEYENTVDDEVQTPTQQPRRKIRGRGCSLGDVQVHPLQSLFEPPQESINPYKAACDHAPTTPAVPGTTLGTQKTPFLSPNNHGLSRPPRRLTRRLLQSEWRPAEL